MTELDPARVKDWLRLDNECYLEAQATDLATAWLASLDHIAAFETASRALAAKLEECEVHISRAIAFFDNHRQPYKRPHYRDELDALIAVLEETK